MIQIMSRLSNGYQITLPSALRKAFNIGAGDEVEMVETKEGILLRKALTREERVKAVFESLDEWREDLPEEAKEKIKKYAGWTANQYREYIDSLPETKARMEEKYGA